MNTRIKMAMVFLSALVVAYGFVGGVVKTAPVNAEDVYQELSVFMDILHKIQSDYVDVPNLRSVMKGALLGMVESLDPFSSYVDAQTHAALAERPSEATPGLEVCKRYGYLYVTAVLPGGSAQSRGIRTGDLIEYIDDEPASSMSVWEAQKRLLGPVDSEVEIRVIRFRRQTPETLGLKRSKPAGLAVRARMVEDGIGLLRIPSFEDGVAEAVRDRLAWLKDSGMRALLVDVRGAAWGKMENAVEVADFFLGPDAVVMTLRGRGDQSRVFKAANAPLVADSQIVVLVDGGTSGAAEIFAAGLKDNQAARILGERTNGQGSVQESFRLQDGSLLVLSTGFALRPSGEAVQGESQRDSGLVPDLRCPTQQFKTDYFEKEAASEDAEPDDGFYRGFEESIKAEQLRQAIEEIRGGLLKKAA